MGGSIPLELGIFYFETAAMNKQRHPQTRYWIRRSCQHLDRKEIDGILRDGVLVSHTEGRIIEARVSHRKSS